MDNDETPITPLETEPDEYNRFIAAARRAIAETTGFFIDGIHERGESIGFNVWIYDATGSDLMWYSMPKDLIRAFTYTELVQHIKTKLSEALERNNNPPTGLYCKPADES